MAAAAEPASASVSVGVDAGAPASEKPIEKRLAECMAVLQKLTRDLAIPYNSPEVQELKTHMDAYINHGTCWSGTVSFLRFGRVAEVVLPRGAQATVEVTLRVAKYVPKRYR